MQQHRISLGGRGGQTSAVEPIVGRALRHIAERQAGEDAVALDRVQRAADSVTHIVKDGGQRLADAVSVVAVPTSARDAGHDAGAQQALAVDDRVVGLRTQRAHVGGDLGQCRRRGE